MATKLEAKPKQVHLAEVVRHGEAFVVPEGLPLDSAIEQLQRLQRMEEEVYRFTHTFEAFIWDGAVAFSRAVTKVFGFAFGERTYGWGGSTPPELVEVALSADPADNVMVPWGELTLPNIEGSVYTTGGVENGKFVFKLVANVKRKHEKQLKALAAAVREELASGSIYRGKAIKVAFSGIKIDPWSGEKVPNTPEFLKLGTITADQLILNRDVSDALDTSLFTPIDRLEDCRRFGEGGKRGVLLAGMYGTGKTLAMTVAAGKAQKAGITFLLCEDASEFAQAVEFAKMYAPAVVACEDIDGALQGERTPEMNKILNTVDGIESKNTEIMVVLTTNNVEAIHDAALRPGRFDAVINFQLPDVDAAERLIKLNAGGAVDPSVDLSEAAAYLAGNIPAVIAEAVKRAKLSAIKLSEPGAAELTITPEAMLDAAKSMRHQIELLSRGKRVEPSLLEKAAAVFGNYVVHGMQTAVVQATNATSEEAVKALGVVQKGIDAHRNGKSTLPVVLG